MSIPAKNPTTEVRDAAVLVSLTATTGNGTSAAAVLSQLGEVARNALYTNVRNAAIDAALAADTALTTKKVKIQRMQHNVPGSAASIQGTVDPTGTGVIIGPAGNGMVSISVTHVFSVPVDRIAGLVA